MHIVQLNYAYEPDILQPAELLARYTTLTGWSEALLRAGASQVTVVQLFGRDADLLCNGVSYHLRRDPMIWPRRLHQVVAALRPSLIHVNGLTFAWQLWQLRRSLPMRIPLLAQDHGNAFHADPLRRALVRRGLRAADAFMFSAEALATPWRAAGLIAPTQPVYAVMESSTTLRPLSRELARASSGVSGHPAILWVGRLNANKDPLTALDGFERALARLPDAQLTMVYSMEELLPQIQARLAASPTLAARVQLRGRIAHDELAAFYSAADLFVLGSHHEGSGYALIEALACGLTPIVTDIPSFRALTNNGALGVLWPVEDANTLAHALIQQGSYTTTQRSRQRVVITQHFARALSWDALGRRALEVYKSTEDRLKTKE